MGSLGFSHIRRQDLWCLWQASSKGLFLNYISYAHGSVFLDTEGSNSFSLPSGDPLVGARPTCSELGWRSIWEACLLPAFLGCVKDISAVLQTPNKTGAWIFLSQTSAADPRCCWGSAFLLASSLCITWSRYSNNRNVFFIGWDSSQR